MDMSIDSSHTITNNFFFIICIIFSQNNINLLLNITNAFTDFLNFKFRLNYFFVNYSPLLSIIQQIIKIIYPKGIDMVKVVYLQPLQTK